MKERSQVAVKYRDRAGNTWTGRGAYPAVSGDKTAQLNTLPALPLDLVLNQSIKFLQGRNGPPDKDLTHSVNATVAACD